MTTIGQVTNEIEQSIAAFGLRAERHESACLAALYVHHRPELLADKMADVLANVPELRWESGDTQRIKLSVMRSLIAHLDSLYLVDTFEHDGQSER